MNTTRKIVELITGPVLTVTGTGNLASGITDHIQDGVERAFVAKQTVDISNSRFYQQNYNSNCQPAPIISPFAGGTTSGALLAQQTQQCTLSAFQQNLAALQSRQIPESQRLVWPPQRFQQYQPYVPPRPKPVVIANAGQPIPSLGPCTNVIGFPNSSIRPNPGNPMTIPEYSDYINRISPGVLPSGKQCF